MTFAGYLFTAIIRPRFSAPLGTLAFAALLAWAWSAQALVRQIAAHAPTAMSFSEAVKASKDGEVYVRMTGATPDCTRVIDWSFGPAVALVDGHGEVAAVGHFDACPRGASSSLEGEFLDPPYGLYGEAVARGWSVTPGHLAYFESDPTRSRAWTRIFIAMLTAALVVGCVLAGVRAERRKGASRVWRMRALGLGMMAGLSWFSYYAHEYVVFDVLPASVFVVVGFAVALAYVVAPPYMQKVAARVLPPESSS
jgi:fluoride ion exporter CrcB/FEX